MKTESVSIVQLTSVANEFEAAPIVSVLENHGIDARAVGGYTTSFRAEAPGRVSILVKRTDLERAQVILEELESERDEIDWSSVDVGDSSQSDETLSNTERQHRAMESPRFQFRLHTLLILQALVCILFALLHDSRAAAICAALFIVVMLLSIVAGTVLVATNPQRVKKWLKWTLVAGLVVEAFPLIDRLLRAIF